MPAPGMGSRTNAGPVQTGHFSSATMTNNSDRSQNRIRLLFFSHATLPFVRQDEAILGKHFDLKPFYLDRYDTIPAALLSYTRVLFWLLKNIRHCDGLFLRFADVYGFFFSLFARLFRKKLFVVVGGFDATWIPELNYGTYNKSRSRFFTRFTLKTACRILPVSESLVENPSKAPDVGIYKQGIKTLYPEIDPKKIAVVPNGYRTSHFNGNGQRRSAGEVTLVGNIKKFQTFKVKGVDTFIRLAAGTPEYTFTLVGADPEQIAQWADIPANLNILPAVPHGALPEYYRRAKVFVCLSRTEGMPNVLCEAMLCECVPVGFDFGAIPEIIGDTGVILQSTEMERLQSALRKAMTLDGRKARARIVDRYPIETREKKLAGIIESEFSNSECNALAFA